jgi:hypothetical protein
MRPAPAPHSRPHAPTASASVDAPDDMRSQAFLNSETFLGIINGSLHGFRPTLSEVRPSRPAAFSRSSLPLPFGSRRCPRASPRPDAPLGCDTTRHAWPGLVGCGHPRAWGAKDVRSARSVGGAGVRG